ncbi:MAG: polyhydroxyalkanoate synthesis repressor PhaR [Gammaproteobacteria bacterium]|nr:polyhydroxyalkanoate synthesis repressor PhaR [Gammaproteobacteria bacterium]
MHRLKKYPNRRLYDTTDSKYVTLQDLRRLIVKGESISVADSRDGSDLTRAVLMQILAEQEAEGHEPVLTNRALEQIIRFYGARLGNVASRYIEQSMLTLLEHQDQFRSRMRQLSELNPLNLMRQALDGAAPRNPPPAADKPVAGEPPEAGQS